jgi:hypothetical protein
MAIYKRNPDGTLELLESDGTLDEIRVSIETAIPEVKLPDCSAEAALAVEEIVKKTSTSKGTK